MSNPIVPKATISLPDGFRFSAVIPVVDGHLLSTAPAPPSLGPLAAFVGSWEGSGFNTIFRPDNPVTPTPLPTPVPVSDNILELNLTSETLTFSPSLGAVPNRGSNPQGDIFLNGVPYLQAINDVTIAGQTTGIHLEPGMWVIVPSTTAPAEGQTLVRMASIPHGTTIQAQGVSTTAAGKPIIPAVNITPFVTGQSQATAPITFPSQTATNQGTPRIPQDLTSFIAAGTITQAMLTDPNTVLRNHIATQTITTTTTISIDTLAPTGTNPPTQPAAGTPAFGGGTDNIAFLQGDGAKPLPTRPNAQSLQMTATFWIEAVEQTIVVPVFKPGQPPLLVKPETTVIGQRVPTFSVTPPKEITEPITIKVTSTQIQYSQTVLLNFNGLTWPHISVATLVPADAVVVPPSAWE